MASALFTGDYQGRGYPRLQIRAIEDLLNGRGFDTPTRIQTLGWVTQRSLPLELAAQTRDTAR